MMIINVTVLLKIVCYNGILINTKYKGLRNEKITTWAYGNIYFNDGRGV